MNTQHTPGPWQIHPNRNWAVSTLTDADGAVDLIAECGFIEDARLIAAAPELLTALEALLTEFESRVALVDELTPPESLAMHYAQDAIAKAKGQP